MDKKQANYTHGEIELPIRDKQVCPFDLMHSRNYRMAEAAEHWKNRLSFETLNFIEEYLKRRIAVVLNFRARGGAYHVRFVASLGDEMGDFFLPALCDDSQPGDSDMGNEHMVFISNVQGVEDAQGFAVPSSVWLYALQDARDDI